MKKDIKFNRTIFLFITFFFSPSFVIFASDEKKQATEIARAATNSVYGVSILEDQKYLLIDVEPKTEQYFIVPHDKAQNFIIELVNDSDFEAFAQVNYSAQNSVSLFSENNRGLEGYLIPAHSKRIVKGWYNSKDSTIVPFQYNWLESQDNASSLLRSYIDPGVIEGFQKEAVVPVTLTIVFRCAWDNWEKFHQNPPPKEVLRKDLGFYDPVSLLDSSDRMVARYIGQIRDIVKIGYESKSVDKIQK